jgi:hypothetical protein
MRRAHVTGDEAKLASEREAIRDELHQTKSWNFEGVIGKEYFDENGEAHMPTYIVEIENGDFKLLDTVQAQ